MAWCRIGKYYRSDFLSTVSTKFPNWYRIDMNNRSYSRKLSGHFTELIVTVSELTPKRQFLQPNWYRIDNCCYRIDSSFYRIDKRYQKNSPLELPFQFHYLFSVLLSFPFLQWLYNHNPPKTAIIAPPKIKKTFTIPEFPEISTPFTSLRYFSNSSGLWLNCARLFMLLARYVLGFLSGPVPCCVFSFQHYLLLI